MIVDKYYWQDESSNYPQYDKESTMDAYHGLSSDAPGYVWKCLCGQRNDSGVDTCYRCTASKVESDRTTALAKAQLLYRTKLMTPREYVARVREIETTYRNAKETS